MDLDALLGIDSTDHVTRQAKFLVDADNQLLESLVKIRKDHLSQAEVGDLMGISQSAVAKIEGGERDPRLSTLRRYAMAIGALVSHDVRPVSKMAPIQTRDVIWASDIAASWEAGVLHIHGPSRQRV